MSDIPTIETLKTLRRQIDVAISSWEAGEMKISEEQSLERYVLNEPDFIIGDFAIVKLDDRFLSNKWYRKRVREFLKNREKGWVSKVKTEPWDKDRH